MNREEYIKKNNEDIDKMSIEDLRAYAKRIDTNAQVYFNHWCRCESNTKELIAKNKQLERYCDSLVKGINDKSIVSIQKT